MLSSISFLSRTTYYVVIVEINTRKTHCCSRSSLNPGIQMLFLTPLLETKNIFYPHSKIGIFEFKVGKIDVTDSKIFIDLN